MHKHTVLLVGRHVSRCWVEIQKDGRNVGVVEHSLQRRVRSQETDTRAVSGYSFETVRTGMNVDDTQPTEEQVLEQHSLSFLNDTLLIAATQKDYYVSIGDMCLALGLKTRGQQQRIQRSP